MHYAAIIIAFFIFTQAQPVHITHVKTINLDYAIEQSFPLDEHPLIHLTLRSSHRQTFYLCNPVTTTLLLPNLQLFTQDDIKKFRNSSKISTFLPNSSSIFIPGHQDYSEVIELHQDGSYKNSLSYIHGTSPITALTHATIPHSSGELIDVIVSGSCDGSIAYYDSTFDDPHIHGSYLNQWVNKKNDHVEEIFNDWINLLNNTPLDQLFFRTPDEPGAGIHLMTGFRNLPFIAVIRDNGTFQIFDLIKRSITQELNPIHHATALFYHRYLDEIIICTATGMIIRYKIIND